MNINNSTSPLVSVVVATYNSSATVIETLESIKNQTYQNIELIVTDDCSTDNTVIICQKWLSENKNYFVHSELVTTLQNTGVSGNFNRGIFQSKGEWIKSIAGDDLLIPTAIEEYVYFVKNHAEKVRMCVCDVECFSTDCEVPESLKKSYDVYFDKERAIYQQQLTQVLQKNVFVGPSFFYSRELFDEIGGFNISYGNGEEWPFAYKVLKSGNRIFAIDKKLVRYRFSLNSMSHFRNKSGLRNKRLELSLSQFYFDFPFKDLLKESHYLLAWDGYLYYKTLQLYCKSDGSKWASFLHKYSRYLSPYNYVRKIKRIINAFFLKMYFYTLCI